MTLPRSFMESNFSSRAEYEASLKLSDEERLTAEKNEADARKVPAVNAPEPMKIGYWKIRGLGAPCRMAAAYAGIPYESVEYEVTKTSDGGWDRSSWFDKKPVLVAKNAMMNLPYVIDGDVVITQSNACLMYIGRKGGLVGKTEAELCAVEQALCQLMDLRNSTVGLAYGSYSQENAEQHLSGNVAANFKKLDSFMQQHGTKYLASDTPTVADFHMFEMIDQAVLLAKFTGAPSPLNGFEHLAALYQGLLHHPKLAAYFASTQYTLPQNNKMAKYGGDLIDGR